MDLEENIILLWMMRTNSFCQSTKLVCVHGKEVMLHHGSLFDFLLMRLFPCKSPRVTFLWQKVSLNPPLWLHFIQKFPPRKPIHLAVKWGECQLQWFWCITRRWSMLAGFQSVKEYSCTPKQGNCNISWKKTNMHYKNALPHWINCRAMLCGRAITALQLNLWHKRKLSASRLQLFKLQRAGNKMMNAATRFSSAKSE